MEEENFEHKDIELNNIITANIKEEGVKVAEGRRDKRK